MLAWSVRGSNIGAASGHDDLLATLRLHKEVPILTTARDRYVAQDACASAIEATYERCSVSLEVPDAHVERERLATPGGVSTAGHLTGERRSLRCRQGRRPRSDRLKDGPYSSRPASCERPRGRRATTRVTPPETPSRRARSNMGLASRSSESDDSISLCGCLRHPDAEGQV